MKIPHPETARQAHIKWLEEKRLGDRALLAPIQEDAIMQILERGRAFVTGWTFGPIGSGIVRTEDIQDRHNIHILNRWRAVYEQDWTDAGYYFEMALNRNFMEIRPCEK